MRRLSSILCFVLAAIMMILTVWGARQSKEVERLRAGARADALAVDSVQVSMDSSREVAFSAAVRRTVGDSVRLFQRRIFQVKQVGDSLDRALGLERAARYRVEAQVVALTVQSRGPVEPPADSTDVRSARFGVRQEPYYIDVAVALPRPPGEGQMTAHVLVDSAVFEARVGCGTEGVAGVKPATLTLAGPRWIQASIARVDQEPRVCSPDTADPRKASTGLKAVLSRFGLHVGYAVVITPDGRVAHGPGAGVGFIAWP